MESWPGQPKIDRTSSPGPAVAAPPHRPSPRSGPSDAPSADAAAPPLSVPRTIWDLTVPLMITLRGLPDAPFVAAAPRVSYLPLLLPRLRAFFPGRLPGPAAAFYHEDVQLRALPVGLLADLHRPPLPWRLTVDDDDAAAAAADPGHAADAFLNGAKEADFVRNGHAKLIMAMSKADTTALWDAVRDADYAAWARINARLLNSPADPLRHVPLRIYIPSSSSSNNSSAAASDPAATAAGSFRVMQTLVPPKRPNRTPQTLGPTLHDLLPTLFPSSRDPVLATVVLHGAPLPFSAPLEGLMREAAYPDGWLCLAVVPL